MAAALLDTHAWAWSLTDVGSLSARAREVMATAAALYVSPVSFFEIAQKVRLGKWPTMTPVVNRLDEIARDQGALIAPLSAEICLDAGLRDWPHRDPFDRLLAVTCERLNAALVTCDPVFVRMGIPCVW